MNSQGNTLYFEVVWVSALDFFSSPSLFMLLFLFFIFKLAWTPTPTPCFQGPEPKIQISCCGEWIPSVCGASCLRKMDPGWTSGQSSFPGTWHAVSDAAEANGNEERERTVQKCCFVWEEERDAWKCQEGVSRKKWKHSIDFCSVLGW